MEYNVEVPIYVQVVRDIKKRIVRKQTASRREAAFQPGTCRII